MSEDNKTNKPAKSDLILDFGEEFGCLCKQNISELFVDIHASIAPLDPLNKMDAAAEAAC